MPAVSVLRLLLALLMANFPIVQTTSSNGSTIATNTPTITLPTGITSGDKVIVFLSFNQTAGNKAAPITWPAGWIKPTNDNGDSTSAAFFVGYRDCDGTEPASITPTVSISDNYSYACYRVSPPAGFVLAGAPEVAVHVVDGGATPAAPNPPNLAPVGGAQDYLWFAATGWDSGLNNWSANPANYTTNALHFDSSNVAAVALAGVAVGTRQLNAASDDPGAFTLTANDQFCATTVAVFATPVATFYLNNPVQGGSNAGLLDTTAPTASTSTTGWTVGTTAINQYSRQTYNTEVAVTGFTSTVQPSGAPVNLGEDCYRLSAVTTGQFSAGTWYSSVSVIAVTSGGIQQGRARFRIWRSTNADGTSGTELTQGVMVGSQVTELNTSVAQSSSASTQIAASNLTNEFLFQQIAWETL